MLHGLGSFILNLIIAWGVELISSPASFIMLPAVKAMGSESFVRSSTVSPEQKRFRWLSSAKPVSSHSSTTAHISASEK